MSNAAMPGSVGVTSFSGAQSPSPTATFAALAVRSKALREELDDDEAEALVSLEGEGHRPLEVLSYLTEQVHREQEIYWSRFQGFATMQAGILVLVAAEVIKAPVVASSVGLGLGLLWYYVQWISKTYTDRPKRLYHAYRRALGIRWEYERTSDARKKSSDVGKQRSSWSDRLGEWIQRNTNWSSTDLGTRVPLAICVVWLIALVDAGSDWLSLLAA